MRWSHEIPGTPFRQYSKHAYTCVATYYPSMPSAVREPCYLVSNVSNCCPADACHITQLDLCAGKPFLLPWRARAPQIKQELQPVGHSEVAVRCRHRTQQGPAPMLPETQRCMHPRSCVELEMINQTAQYQYLTRG